MRITSTTSVPVRAKEMTAAGPAEPMTTPLPTNSPAPITPPSAIICMWRRCSERRRPLAARSGAAALALIGPALSRERLVLGEVPHGLRERVAAERVAELLGDHHLEHGGAALGLGRRGGAQRRLDVAEPLDRDALAAEGLRHFRPARILQVHALVAARIEIDVILLLGAPLAVVENDRRHAELLARAGEELVEADAPGAVADVGESRALGGRDLGAADDRKGVAAVAEAHRRE